MKEGHLSLCQLMEKMSYNPARLYAALRVAGSGRACGFGDF